MTYNLRVAGPELCLQGVIEGTIDIYNNLGYKVASFEELGIKGNSGEIILNTNNWEKGLYFIKMQVGDQVFTGRGVKL